MMWKLLDFQLLMYTSYAYHCEIIVNMLATFLNMNEIYYSFYNVESYGNSRNQETNLIIL